MTHFESNFYHDFCHRWLFCASNNLLTSQQFIEFNHVASWVFFLFTNLFVEKWAKSPLQKLIEILWPVFNSVDRFRHPTNILLSFVFSILFVCHFTNCKITFSNGKCRQTYGKRLFNKLTIYFFFCWRIDRNNQIKFHSLYL